MRVYKVSFYSESGIDLDYGVYLFKFRAMKKANAKMRDAEKIFEPDSKLNCQVMYYKVGTEKTDVVGSWILRENGKFTPETDEDAYNWLVDNKDKYGYTLN